MDRARTNQESYDRLAALYVERNRDRSGLAQWLQGFAARVPAGGLVLDLGAGPCLDSADLRALGLRVVSLDRSAGMLRVACEQLPGPRVLADMRALPFAAQTFAGVWASASLLHIDRAELVPTLREIARVLVPGGTLFASFKQGEGEERTLSSYGTPQPRWFTYWTGPALDQALHAAGFTIRQSATQPGRAEHWLLRLAHNATIEDRPYPERDGPR